MHGSGPTRTADDVPDGVPDDVVADLLADDSCRRILEVPAGTDDALAIDDLARVVLAGEREVESAAVDDERVGSVSE